MLLGVGASDGEALGEGKETSLGMAAYWGQEGVAAVLLDAGLEALGGVEAVRAAMKDAHQSRLP